MILERVSFPFLKQVTNLWIIEVWVSFLQLYGLFYFCYWVNASWMVLGLSTVSTALLYMIQYWYFLWHSKNTSSFKNDQSFKVEYSLSFWHQISNLQKEFGEQKTNILPKQERTTSLELKAIMLNDAWHLI